MKLHKYYLIVCLILVSFVSFAQKKNSDYKQLALAHMQSGRYGEAIELLNKYVTANPRVADGYNIRGLCFEKRGQYEYAVLDFRRATKLDNKNNEIRKNLDRVISIWYPMLNKKILGYQREIAINANKATNYLEIGKCYRWLEQWSKAEEWYDEYLKRDDNASPDEIIRYTEILAQTNNLVKGEKILKTYVDRYPTDWRLWSRYGYFLLWLGKAKLAEKAFENALSFKPFFVEAQDGLDLARREGYVTKEDPKSFEQPEYAIDRLSRMLKQNPNDLDTRFKLIDELIKAKRIEEAYQQLLYIDSNAPGDPRFQEKYDYVLDYRDTNYKSQIEKLTAKLEKNPKDKTSVKEIAQYYEYLQDYDNAIAVLEKYFTDVPDEKDADLKYTYAVILAWSQNFDDAIVAMDDVLSIEPDNLKYQLFRAQLSVWTGRDLESAEVYLNNVLAKEPENLEALISMGSLKLGQNDFEAAQSYSDKAKAIAPENPDLARLNDDIQLHKERAEQERQYLILEDGRKQVMAGNCADAISYYQQYLDAAGPNDQVRKEMGDVYFCAKDYNEALTIYNDLLTNNGFDYDIGMQRAKVYFAMGDSINALSAFKEVVKEEPEDFEANLYLGDAYAKVGIFDTARAVYDSLRSRDLDSTQIALLDMRKSWVASAGFSNIISNFPSAIGLAPSGAFYSDNLGFKLYKYGGRLEFGTASFLSLGVSFFQNKVQSDTESRAFNVFKGHVYVRISERINAGAGYGTVNSLGIASKKETDAFITYAIKDRITLQGTYLRTDASLLLYSSNLINVRYDADHYRINANYTHPNGIVVLGYFQYIKVYQMDETYGNNEGNDLQLRVGRKFDKELTAGYEYFFSNYRYTTPLYYSPNNFSSHALWGEYLADESKEYSLTLGGRLGYVPVSDFVIMEGYAAGEYKPMEKLIIQAKLTMGSSSRNDSSYKYVSGFLSAYWSIY
ncbi:MAG: tetratricopeptide repeat protein [bacterium]